MLSSADAPPISGLPPAPRPREVPAPRPSLFGDRLASSACLSVLIAQYSTASLSACPNWIILLIAFPPPPPTPTTLITHGLTEACIATRNCVAWPADERSSPECIVYACELHCSAASTAIVRRRTGMPEWEVGVDKCA